MPSALDHSSILKTGAGIMRSILRLFIRIAHVLLRKNFSSNRYTTTWRRSMANLRAGIGSRQSITTRTIGTTTVIPWVVTHFLNLGNSAIFIWKSPIPLQMDTFISEVKLPAAITPGSQGHWIRHGGVFGKFSPRTELRSKRKSSRRSMGP